MGNTTSLVFKGASGFSVFIDQWFPKFSVVGGNLLNIGGVGGGAAAAMRPPRRRGARVCFYTYQFPTLGSWGGVWGALQRAPQAPKHVKKKKKGTSGFTFC